MSRFPVNVSVTPWFCFVAATMLLVLPIDWLLGWLVAVLFHELGHVAALLLLRKTINSIVFDQNGIYIKTDNMLPLEEIICAAAGPITGLFPLLFSRTFPHGALCALTMSCFNLIPIYPSDGGRVLMGILRLILPPTKVSNICQIVSAAMLFALLLIITYLTLMNHILLPFALVAVVLLFRNIQEKFLANRRN